jgi:putative ABC transport system permease protein
MVRNVLMAALRNLMRNRLYAAISIASLAIGMAAALLTFLYVRDELSFDHFVPGHERVFVVRTNAVFPGQGAIHSSKTTLELAGWMKQAAPQVRFASRTWEMVVAVRRGGTEVSEKLLWADPDFFAVFPLPVVAGDLQSALSRPDGLVITRRAARRYFGSDAPIGQTMQLDRKGSFSVAAVIQDPPGNSSLDGDFYGSGLSPQSRLYIEDHKPYVPGNYLSNVITYVRLADPSEALSVQARLVRVVRQSLFPEPFRDNPMAKTLVLTLAPIGTVHLLPERGNTSGALIVIWALGAIAALVLVAAGVNFVNLSTARAMRRSLEVGVRKVMGASHRQLILQFLGEAMIYAAVGMALAVTLVELVDPAMNGLFLRKIPFAYWRDPGLIAAIFGLTLVMGLGAGLYPALVLSGFRPALALKPAATKVSGSAVARYGMVVAQFAILIGLTLAVLVIGRQTWFSMTVATGLNTEQVVRIGAGCRGPFVERLRGIPGIKGLACSSGYAGGIGGVATQGYGPDGRMIPIQIAPVDYGFFGFYGLRPLAGRLPSPDHGEEGLRYGAANAWADGNYTGRVPEAAVINKAAALALGLGSTEKAVGSTFRVNGKGKGQMSVRILGVIPDFTYDLTRGKPQPAFYPVIQDDSEMISVRLEAGRVPDTRAAIEGAWRDVGDPRPLRMRFLTEFFDSIYADVLRQAWLVGLLAGVAGLISALGLFGLAAFVSEQRTKEIGVRKALGASTGDILALMVWSFTRPVLLANLIAWPLGWLALDRWLQGFSVRISLSPWLFLAAGAAAFLIAALTVSGHALRVARAKPVGALRYE